MLWLIILISSIITFVVVYIKDRDINNESVILFGLGVVPLIIVLLLLVIITTSIKKTNYYTYLKLERARIMEITNHKEFVTEAKRFNRELQRLMIHNTTWSYKWFSFYFLYPKDMWKLRPIKVMRRIHHEK